eukprot:TRINITY_DN20506_c0_g1_i1.p1 TRINITY_DN20506_c0_g1~~TRINITY_DN20506_c0_g1_i1.p1  ORF type:complete len:203 (+),score=57.97 TRINITY_DN20506_c0_g1_i1:123-731(+)
MSKPKLTYFNGRGTGEIVRLVFAQAGVEYEDNRVDSIADLKEKGVLTFGQVPLLEIDGLFLNQSLTIARYLSRKYGLYGKNDLEATKIDLVLDGLLDVRAKYFASRDSTPENKQAKADEFNSKTLPLWLGYFEKLLAKENTGYYVGNSITLADLHAFNFLTTLINNIPGALDSAPLVKAHYDRIGSSPKIAAWVEKRPKTSF